MLDTFRICIEGKDLATLPKQVDEVAPIAAPGVEHAHGRDDVAAQDLIEDVDIDLSKLFLNAQHASIIVWRIDIPTCQTLPIQRDSRGLPSVANRKVNGHHGRFMSDARS